MSGFSSKSTVVSVLSALGVIVNVVLATIAFQTVRILAAFSDVSVRDAWDPFSLAIYLIILALLCGIVVYVLAGNKNSHQLLIFGAVGTLLAVVISTLSSPINAVFLELIWLVIMPFYVRSHTRPAQATPAMQ